MCSNICDPVAAINEWSCVLACVEWILKSAGVKDQTQETLLHSHIEKFHRWKAQKGVMTRGDLLNLIEQVGVPFRSFSQFNTKKEVVSLFSERYSDFVAGFVFTRTPTNHCMAFVACDGDTVTLMNPDQKNPTSLKLAWDDLFKNHDADVLWLFR